MSLKATLIISATLILGACTHTAQYTSGQDYLAGYTDNVTFHTTIDQEVRDIAAVEPNLRFPARIGLARIDKKRLISLPIDEAEHWQDMGSELGARYGDFIPVSPLVAGMVNPERHRNSQVNVVEEIRRGAARQHLDYVLIYEVMDVSDSKRNALQLADLSVLGLFILPSRDVKIEATATAMMIDVRNGYPYGTASAFADKKGISTAIDQSDKKRKLTDKAREHAVDNLTAEVKAFMKELKAVEAGMKLAESRK
jgi:hypothetical protein